MTQISAIAPSLDRPETDMAAVLSQLLSEACAFVDRDRSAAKSCIDRALALIERDVGRRETAGPAGVPSAGNRTLAPWQAKRVNAFIAANLDRAIQVGELADVTRLTVSYFSRAFSGSFGVSPQAYITERRMDLACHLMLTTDAPLSRIALDCGLADQAHFSKMFSRVFGSPPGVWRRNRRGSVARLPSRAA
jgi:AraC family transcriptional regulator